MEFQLRDKIDRQYVVTEKHYGGMSVVYIVLDEFSQRRFAVKTLKEELLSDRVAIGRFADEARTWMNLGRHPNIVEAIIYREIEDQPFLFLEYVEGSNLQVLIEAEQTLFPPQVVEFMLQACAGMQYVHAVQIGPGGQGVVHRDLKPANMMLTREATVKITDFGLAKAFGVPSAESDVGIGLGTYLYMPPEQLLDASSADRTSDVYSFGVALFAALVGRPPIQGRSANAVVRAIMNQEAPRPSQLVPGLPAILDQVVLGCLAKRREDRYQGFAQVEAALQSARPTVVNAYTGQAGVRRCEGCGYLTWHNYASCPLCANAVVPTAYPPAAAAPPTAPAGPAAPPTAPGEPSPEEAAIAELARTALDWREKGDLNRAANLLRQALTILPGHVETRRLLDETVLLLARQRPRTPQKAYNWPMFRGNLARTGLTPEVIVPPLARKWQAEVGDWVLASPVVSNGLVFIGGRRDRPALQGHFLALHVATGQPVWSFDTGNEIVLTASVLGGQTLLLAASNRLYALEAKSGHRLWDVGTGASVTTAPAATQHGLYFGCDDGLVLGLNPQNGQRQWLFQTELAVYSSPLVWEGVVYVGSSDHRLYALDQQRGKLLWQFMAASDITSTPAIRQGRLYVAARDHRLYCLDVATGRRIWEFATGGPCNCSPAIWQDTVYIGSRDKRLYALDANTGALRWHFEAGDWIESSPAVSGRTVYFGCHNTKFYALEAETGILLWEYATGGEVGSSPAISAGRVFVGCNDGYLYCFTGTP